MLIVVFCAVIPLVLMVSCGTALFCRADCLYSTQLLEVFIIVFEVVLLLMQSSVITNYLFTHQKAEFLSANFQK